VIGYDRTLSSATQFLTDLASSDEGRTWSVNHDPAWTSRMIRETFQARLAAGLVVRSRGSPAFCERRIK